MRKNTNLSKSTLIRSIQCQKSLYLYKYFYNLRDKISKEQQAVFNRGHNIGELAQNLFPDGKNVAPKSPRYYHQSVNATSYLIKQSYPVIYEAAFRHNGIIIFLDILVNRGNKWYAYEVKSSKRISETYIKDAAIQYYVIKNSGLEVSDFSIIYVNAECEYDKVKEYDLNHLFIEQSVLDKIETLQPYINDTVAKAKATLNKDEIPQIEMGNQCDNPYVCDFKGYCSQNPIHKQQ